MTTLFDDRFQQRCQYLDQVARRSWGNRFLGRQLDRRWAGGSELVGHSDYTSGDDFRYIDWQICARHDELVTRQYRGSEDRVVYLLLDCAATMDLGSPRKFDIARQLTAALAYLALANMDRVSVVAVSNRVLADSPPIRGKRHCGRVFRFLDSLAVDPVAVDLAGAVESFVQDRPRRGTTVVLSDFLDPGGFEPAIDLLAKRGFPPFLLQVVDRLEAEPVMSGNVQLMDAVTGRSRTANLDEIDLRNYRQVFREFSAACRRYCARRRIGIIQTRTDTPLHESVLRVIRTSTSRMYAQQ